MAKVTIENLPYDEVIRRYDKPSTLFYLDPPYWGLETLYGKGLFARADFARLAELLAGLKGVFMMSLNDRAEIRRMYADFTIETVETVYAAQQRGRNRKVKELHISGGGALPV